MLFVTFILNSISSQGGKKTLYKDFTAAQSHNDFEVTPFLNRSGPGQPAGAMYERDKIVMERLNKARAGWMLSRP